MIATLVCIANLCYGLGQTIRMWRRRQKTEAIVLLSLTLFIIGYFLPATAAYWPTVQKVNSRIFQPVSDYVLHLLQIHVGEL
ncbi:hypothetical protein ACFPES_15520 [Paenibacillus sp. GCM10023248]|uniref:hypothetical protein n=1 Tax=Bacillales TaxID=1385 RepID=UPI00237879C4|nr:MULTISPECIES: hypothetical protein [Bacillales]MDD9268450.1 hypothetical protein [Paenibacillus sp. MAHUQ-63]MDR6879339.1 hypothetical protein [Bacillus sp. 3255]